MTTWFNCADINPINAGNKEESGICTVDEAYGAMDEEYRAYLPNALEAVFADVGNFKYVPESVMYDIEFSRALVARSAWYYEHIFHRGCVDIIILAITKLNMEVFWYIRHNKHLVSKEDYWKICEHLISINPSAIHYTPQYYDRAYFLQVARHSKVRVAFLKYTLYHTDAEICAMIIAHYPYIYHSIHKHHAPKSPITSDDLTVIYACIYAKKQLPYAIPEEYAGNFELILKIAKTAKILPQNTNPVIAEARAILLALESMHDFRAYPHTNIYFRFF